jgi:3-dehydroquinate dehydratase type I
VNPKICVSITPDTNSGLAIRSRRAKELAADFLEVRFEKLHNHSKALKELSKIETPPLIATTRPFLSPKIPNSRIDKQRFNVLLDGVNAGIEYVDLDFETDNLASKFDQLRQNNAKIILSTHDYSRTPNLRQLRSIIQNLRSNKPDICKVITTARSTADNLVVLNALEENRDGIPLVCFAMGKTGVWSRILAPFHGAPFTYASLEKGSETAPGQPSISELREIYSILGAQEKVLR